MAIRCSVFAYHKICVFVQIARNCSNTLLVTQTDINGEMFLHGSLSLLCSNSTTWLLVRVVHELPAEGNIQASTF